MRYLFYYLLSINIISFICMGLDKFRASRDRWRIPERTLFLLAAAGEASDPSRGCSFSVTRRNISPSA